MLRNTNSKDKGVSPVTGVLIMIAAFISTITSIVAFVLSPVLNYVFGFSRTQSIATGIGVGLTIAAGLFLKNTDELAAQVEPTSEIQTEE